MHKTTVAIVGRKNVGKSTLLNRMAGKRISIVEDLPGTTRDRIMADVTWQNKEFALIDTGGVEFEPINGIAEGINKQIDIAIGEADIIIFLVDALVGLHPDDYELANRLRRTKKPVLLVVNKADNERSEFGTTEFFKLSLGEPVPISSYHGRGVADLMDKIVSFIPEPEPGTSTAGAIKVAIVGKPNVGKSTLLNALLGEERSIVDSTPGTTRDAIDTAIDFQGQSVILIDTAGIKRAGKIESGVEQYSVIRSREAIERADIALLVFDASQAVSVQDTHIAGYIQEAAKGIILVANKWDLNKDVKDIEYDKYVKGQFKFIPYASLKLISAKTGQGLGNILPGVLEVYQERMKRLPTNKVNSVIQQAVAGHNLPQKSGRQLKIKYSTQADVNPPTFVFSVNDPALVHFSYRRYLENKIRQAFGFPGTPIRLVFKPRS
jgi:GTP-binding protein